MIKYQKYVDMAKSLLQTIELHQAKIAGYTVAICDIRHGGISDGYYTMVDYARDIDMPVKTLQNWVAVYRNVVVKLKKPIETKEDWHHAKKTNDILRFETNRINKESNTLNKRRTIDTPKAKVREIYTQIQNDPKPFILELNRSRQAAKHIKFLMETRDLNIADKDTLADLMNILDQASDLINDHLTGRVK